LEEQPAQDELLVIDEPLLTALKTEIDLCVFSLWQTSHFMGASAWLKLRKASKRFPQILH